MAIITISREFGAGGSSVARILAADLAADVVDGALVTEVARRLAVPEPDVEREDERPETFADRLLATLRYLAPAQEFSWQPQVDGKLVEPRQEIVRLTQELIREVARLGNAVVVGRGGAFILRDHPNALHVFLIAPEEVRLGTVMSRLMVNEQAARLRMHKADADRAAYIRQLYHADWRDSANYDLVINTGRFGVARAADMVVDAVARRLGREPGSMSLPTPVAE
ncbi:MAG: AAA family ATPase [Candidatus Limnocylindrales bacterium]